MITLDFETEAIQSRPQYPPRPVGLAIRWPDGRAEYMGFGHATGNTHTFDDAARVLKSAFRGDHGPVLFHNAVFDIDVAQCRFGISQWPVFEDTLYLAFLDNPRAETLSLKPLAQQHLRMRASARNTLNSWLEANVQEVSKKPSRAGEFICAAPADLVGKYAMQDVEMTYRLWKKLGPSIEKRGMVGAYERELSITRVTLDMERTGLRVDVPGLKRLAHGLEACDRTLAAELRKRLRVGDDFNLDSPAQIGARLRDLGKLSHVTLTATGKQSTRKGVLLETCTDKELVKVLNVRGVVTKYLNTFVHRWIDAAASSGGRILPRFHQVRNRSDDGTGGGARTGRYSSSDPNLQNVPTNAEESRDGATLILLSEMLAEHGVPGFAGLRHFILPDEGMMWAALDYNQQELRILAHFERGKLLDAYLKDPSLDVHTWLQGMVKDLTGVEYPRKFIKTVVFGLIYGMGYRKLAVQLDAPEDTAARLRNAVLRALPGVKSLMDQTRATIYTWGGREYVVEPPAIIPGDEDSEPVERTFEYKQLNYLIQGSAADCTKAGMHEVAARMGNRIAVQVHDELGIMVRSREEALQAAEAMCAVEFNVPMRVDPKLSSVSWGAVK